MKCYTISPGGKLRKSIEPDRIKQLFADYPLTAKKSIAQAHLGFEPAPIFKLKELVGRENMYSYGQAYLSSTITPLEKLMKFGKTAMLVLYEHGKFYPDKSAGDESEDVWMGRYNCLLITREVKLALREIESGVCFGVKGGKVTKSL